MLFAVLSVSENENPPNGSPQELTQPCAAAVPWTLTAYWDGSSCKVWRSSALPFLYQRTESQTPQLVTPLRQQAAFLMWPPPPTPQTPQEAQLALPSLENDLGYQWGPYKP